MKYTFFILVLIFCAGCAEKGVVKLNDIQTEFDEFPSVDSLKFISISDTLLKEPSKMLIAGEKLLIQTFCKAKNMHLAIFSLNKNQVINEVVREGDGPNEMLACEMNLIDDKLWLYDMRKMRVGFAQVDSFLSNTPNISWYKLNHCYYRTAMLNDSIMLGTNDFENKSKINFVNVVTGEVEGKGSYSHLDNNLNLSALIDACSCYVNVNPKTKDILLSYRYTDVIEIYNSEGKIKYAIQGPEGFDIDFSVGKNGMRKTKKTRKAFVNCYITENNIYLLYSGCRRTDENWVYGTEIFVFSWDAKPLKRYILPQPIYTFAVDESNGVIYSYSRQNEELVKAPFPSGVKP